MAAALPMAVLRARGSVSKTHNSVLYAAAMEPSTSVPSMKRFVTPSTENVAADVAVAAEDYESAVGV